MLRMLVGIDDRVAAARLDRHRHDLILEPAFLLSFFGFRLRAGGELVLLLTSDLPALRHILGGAAHVVAVEGVPQPILDHRIDHLRVAHPNAIAQVDAMRRQAHALLAAGDDDLAVAVADCLETERDAPQPRAAYLVHRVGGGLDGNAGPDRGLSDIGCQTVPAAVAEAIMPIWPKGGRRMVTPGIAVASGSAERGGTIRSRLGSTTRHGALTSFGRTGSPATRHSPRAGSLS